MAYNANAYRITQTSRLYTAMLCSFDRAQLLTFRYENADLPEKVKNDDLKALLKRTHRANARAGSSVRYIVVPEYAQSCAQIVAYHIVTDMAPELCADMCSWWSAGAAAISAVDVRQRETLPRFMFDPSSVRKGHRFYTTSRNISRELSA